MYVTHKHVLLNVNIKAFRSDIIKYMFARHAAKLIDEHNCFDKFPTVSDESEFKSTDICNRSLKHDHKCYFDLIRNAVSIHIP